VQGEGNLPGLAAERSESGKPLGLHKRSAAQCGRLGKPLAGASGQSPLGRVFAVAVRQGQALRTGHRSARGVAQDVPFFTAARLERRAGALTGTADGLRRYVGKSDLINYSSRFIPAGLLPANWALPSRPHSAQSNGWSVSEL